MNARLTVTAAGASAAASTGLFALISGGTWFWAGLGAIIVVALIGSVTRLHALRALPAAACLLAALAGLLLYLNLLYAAKSSFLHVFPSGSSLTQLWRLAVTGMQDTQRDATPVPGVRPILLIAAAGIGLVAALTDLIAVRLRRVALAGLPLLVLFGIPVATGAGKDGATDAVVFCLGMAGYLALLSADGQERLRLWGRLVTPWTGSAEQPAEELGSSPSTRALAASGRRIGLAAVVVALFIPLLIPGLHVHKILPSSGHVPGLGGGPGDGKGPSPLVQMNRQLLEVRPTVVLTYHTDEQDPQYLQMYVLGNLTGGNWTMQLTGQGRAPAGDGALSAVPGLPTGRFRAVRTTIRIQPGALANVAFLPAPYAPRRLAAPGSWDADPGTLMLYTYSQALSGLTYTVDSIDVSPGAGQLDSAPSGAGSMGAYLDVPQAYKSLLPYAKKIVKGATTPGEKAIALENWFTQGNRFVYSLNVNEPSGPAGVRYFLTTSKTGYCQQFAFAMAVLARLLGIPSRVVVGYTAGTPTGHGNYVVKTSDAHAWPELYFRGLGWLRMEPTPAGTGVGQGTAKPPAYGKALGTGGGTSSGGATHAGGGGGPGSQGHKLTKITPVGAPGGVSLGTGAAARTRAGSSGTGPLLTILAVLVALALLTPRAGRSLTRRRRWLTARGDAARAHAAWYELLDDLTDNGLRHAPGETPRAMAKRLTRELRLTPSDRAALARIAEAEERASYAPAPGPAGTLRADVTTLRGAISASVPRSARWRARLLPASAAERMRQRLSHAQDAFGWLEVATTRIRGRLPRPRPADQG